jgi:hypothetical protein
MFVFMRISTSLLSIIFILMGFSLTPDSLFAFELEHDAQRQTASVPPVPLPGAVLSDPSAQPAPTYTRTAPRSLVLSSPQPVGQVATPLSGLPGATPALSALPNLQAADGNFLFGSVATPSARPAPQREENICSWCCCCCLCWCGCAYYDSEDNTGLEQIVPFSPSLAGTVGLPASAAASPPMGQ